MPVPDADFLLAIMVQGPDTHRRHDEYASRRLQSSYWTGQYNYDDCEGTHTRLRSVLEHYAVQRNEGLGFILIERLLPGPKTIGRGLSALASKQYYLGSYATLDDWITSTFHNTYRPPRPRLASV